MLSSKPMFTNPSLPFWLFSCGESRFTTLTKAKSHKLSSVVYYSWIEFFHFDLFEVIGEYPLSGVAL